MNDAPTTPVGAPVMHLDRVAKFYGAKLVFARVSLDLEKGRILLVAGPNGAGKSTLLRIMAGLEQETRGKVEINAPENRIGFLGHQTFIYPRLSGIENLRFWSKIYGMKFSDDALLRSLERMELKHAAHELAGHYSRGMAQRLSLARVFMLDPELVFLDEPSTGLDVRSTQIMLREIKDARDRGASIVWVSHNLERDLHTGDLILELKDNMVSYFGPTSEFELEVCKI